MNLVLNKSVRERKFHLRAGGVLKMEQSSWKAAIISASPCKGLWAQSVASPGVMEKSHPESLFPEPPAFLGRKVRREEHISMSPSDGGGQGSPILL